MTTEASYRVLIVGAGFVNFGTPEGPWNHSKRLEKKLGPCLQVVGLVDPDRVRAEAVLAIKAASPHAASYANATIFPSINDAAAKLDASLTPHAIIVGAPPAFRGTLDPSKGYDMEVQLVKGFPKSALFLEKPVTTGSVEAAVEVGKYLEKQKMLVGIGYMLRYGKAQQMMKKILEENKCEVMMTSARHIFTYDWALKPAWWHKSIDGGPIVENGTHICDLSRFFGGEVDLNSMMAHSIEWYEKPGKLSKLQIDESKIPEDDRIPRFTSATWKYDSGALGHLEYGVSLINAEWTCEITVWADGFQLRLVDLFAGPTLYIKRPNSTKEEVHTFYDDDAYYNEMSSFIDTTETGANKILSSYEDAARTYEMTLAIRTASEKTRRPRSS